MSQQALVVLVTAATLDEAARIGRTIVDERLAACANLLPNLRSIYRWNDVVQDEVEVLLVIKTTTVLFDRLAQRVAELHSYETPEVLALPVAAGSASYLAWLYEQVDVEVS